MNYEDTIACSSASFLAAKEALRLRSHLAEHRIPKRSVRESESRKNQNS